MTLDLEGESERPGDPGRVARVVARHPHPRMFTVGLELDAGVDAEVGNQPQAAVMDGHVRGGRRRIEAHLVLGT